MGRIIYIPETRSFALTDKAVMSLYKDLRRQGLSEEEAKERLHNSIIDEMKSNNKSFRRTAPIVGTVVGGTIGGIVGGPAGLVAGAGYGAAKGIGYSLLHKGVESLGPVQRLRDRNVSKYIDKVRNKYELE